MVQRWRGEIQEASMRGVSQGGDRRRGEQRVLEDLDESAESNEELDLAEAGNRYLSHVEHFRGRKRTTVRDYRIMLDRHLVPFFGRQSIRGIRRTSVEAYQRTKLDERLAPKTVANHVRFLHGIFRYAVGREWAAHNPVSGIEHPRRARRFEFRALSVWELGALMAAVPEDELGRTDRALYLTAAMTGLRRGELQALRWKNVDWSTGVLRVEQSYVRGEFTSPKSARSIRAVPFPERIAEELDRHRRSSRFRTNEDLVFCHPRTGRPYDGSRLLKRYKATLKLAGLREARFHDLRHTFGTHMAAAGAPLRFIQEWMGHGDYRTTSIYAGYVADPSQGAAYASRAFSGLPQRGSLSTRLWPAGS